ncbi:PadR family transcriptional regulator [Xylanimonas allomyrinae]|uniref:PadR family transcriptional regulator n=1 Tax=Xylanimonas allomyrinae TaxID=2509459 RepID=A0A4P6ENV7_9MICO|nr:helix-turn-helix transcriptional regulator [Xylanimonas allomyrinae]QAY63029.1 PadR family transcriptional regulator [Xylanimonas allomyrinae]
MSTVRLFVLDSLVRHGPMHGHQMRALADQEHVDDWTDITVGSLYGALKRLEAEGLLVAVRTEREGNYPPRRVLDITETGRAALAELHAAALAVVGLRPDPVDYALARPQLDQLDDLESVLTDRLAELRAQLTAHTAHLAAVDQYLTVAERLTLTHTTDRLTAEVVFHERMLAAAPAIVADERTRKDPHV